MFNINNLPKSLLESATRILEESENTELDAFRQKWKDAGVDNFVTHRDGVVKLHDVKVPVGQQRKGIGSAFMNDLKQYADKHQATITLSPATDWGSSMTGLKRFYKGHGFVENKGRNKDYTISETMLRHPEKYVEKQVNVPTIETTPLKPLATVKDTTVSKHTLDDDTKTWFNGSKASNAFGDPIVAYHGSPNKAEIVKSGFRKNDDGIFFTNDHKTASTYTKKIGDGESPGIVSAHLNMQNPYYHDSKGAEWTGNREIIGRAKELGHDSVIFDNVIDHYQTNRTKQTKPSKVFVVFHPNQIKQIG